MKRFIFAFIAAYIFTFCWGWLLNGVVLKGIYAETPHLWRSPGKMMNLFRWCDRGHSAWHFVGGRRYRDADGHVCSATFSGKIDSLWQR